MSLSGCRCRLPASACRLEETRAYTAQRLPPVRPRSSASTCRAEHRRWPEASRVSGRSRPASFAVCLGEITRSDHAPISDHVQAMLRIKGNATAVQAVPSRRWGGLAMRAEGHASSRSRAVLLQDVHAEADAVTANEHACASDERADVGPLRPAKGAMQGNPAGVRGAVSGVARTVR